MATETTPVKPGPKLLERMRDKLRAKHLALSTERSYLHWAERFIRQVPLARPVQIGHRRVASQQK
ncbi:phage integrase N-terminal SAM-like domain-containing protein [Anatilimnocola sp. NA78]|uniref:phage integrase N-terminal SAM-like domain-containing protein n=1 Tax=Anatilimnocola sp. NA78 TaxID=3415683 RepID=UPI003CE535E6